MSGSTETIRAIWLHVAKQDARVSAREISKALGLRDKGVRPSGVLGSMVERGILNRIPMGGHWSYAVTSGCRVPAGVTVRDVLGAVAVDNSAPAP